MRQGDEQGLTAAIAGFGQAAPLLATAAPRPFGTAGSRSTHRRADRRGLAVGAFGYDFSTIDWAPDLASDIGSARWFRGLASLIGLTAVALAFWPDFAPLKAAPVMAVDSTARDELRSQMIMPLALGADSGRRVAATDAVVPLADAPERPSIQLTATLGQGDSFGRMLQRAGVGSGEAAQIASLVSGAMPLGDIASGTRFDITLGRRNAANQPRPVETIAFRGRFDLNLEVVRAGGALTLKRQAIAVDATPLRIRGKVGSSLYRSARAAGAPPSAIQEYLRTLAGHLSIANDILPDDEFDIILAYRRSASGETDPGQLMYAGLDRGGKPRAQLLRWEKDGRSQFFEASGVGERRGGMTQPVNGPISSNYGMRRHPILGYLRMHSGMDFKAGHGTPIYAVTDGVVASAGRMGGCGNAVRLNHAGNLATRYCHMSRMAVAGGQRVRQGQIIGYVGSTGLSTGPHLHYEMYKAGRAVNPASVRFVTRSLLEGAELAAFRARLGQVKAVNPGAALASIAPRRVETAPLREIDRLAPR